MASKSVHGRTVQDFRMVFFKSAGNLPEESKIRKVFARARMAGRLTGDRVYDLRHTYATLLLANGAHNLRGGPTQSRKPITLGVVGTLLTRDR
jgi:integrase